MSNPPHSLAAYGKDNMAAPKVAFITMNTAPGVLVPYNDNCLYFYLLTGSYSIVITCRDSSQ